MGQHGVPHLVLRGGVYGFRLAIPHRLWSRFGQRELKSTLRTSDPRLAKECCRRLSSHFERLILLVERMQHLTPETIRALVRQVFEGQLREAKEFADLQIVGKGTGTSVVEEASHLEDCLPQLRSMLATQEFSNDIIETARDVLNEAGLPAPAQASEAFQRLCQGLLRARIESYRILLARLRAEPHNYGTIDKLFQGIEFDLVSYSADSPPPPAKTMGTIVEEYIVSKTSIQAWKSKTSKDYERTLRLFVKVVGSNKEMKAISIADLKSFRDAIMKLPANFEKHLKKDLSLGIAEIISLYPDKEKLGPATIRKYIGFVRTFLHWSHNEGYLPAYPAQKLDLPSLSGNLKREIFDSAQLQAIFSSPLYTGYAVKRWKQGKTISKDAYYWIPLIGLFSGMRLGEIVQLNISDIRQSDAIWYFDVRQDEDGKKQIKTNSSVRKVPVHPYLLSIGLIKYVEAQKKNATANDRVFHEIKPGSDGYYSNVFSKWFGRFLKGIGVKTKTTTFHSFRHTFIDALRAANIEDARAMQLTGHALPGVHGQYGSKQLPLKNLLEAVAAVSYSIKFGELTSTHKAAGSQNSID